MAYNPNRLQFVHHDECFATAELAKEYVSTQIDKISRPALYGEPMILKYGDESNPNIILAIGSIGDGETPSINNKTFFIDSASIEKSIAEIAEEVENQKEIVKQIQDTIKAIIASCGLNEDGLYKVHTDDTILKAAKSLDEADTLLSAYILDLEKRHTLNVESTNTIDLTLDKTENGQTLSANVILADHKTVDKVELPNIILANEDGLFTHVDLDYNEENNDLIFSVNGETKTFELPTETYVEKGEYSTKEESIILYLNTGEKVIIDVRKLIGEWTVIGEFTDTPIILTLTPVKYEDTLHGADLYQDILKADVRIADEDTKPFNILKKTEDGRSIYVDGLAKNIKYLKNGELITVQEGLDNIDCKVSTSNDNNLYKRTDGLFSFASIDYNSSTNVLTFKHSNVSGGTTIEAFTLNSAKLLDDVSYDSSREVIILRFTTADGKTSKIEIPVHDIITEWEVDNSNNTVTLTRTRSVAGTDKLSANVNISSAEYNIVENNGHAIYVRGTADNIRYDEDYTVEGKIKSINVDLISKIEDETKRAKEAEEGLSNKIINNTELIKNESDRAKEVEETLRDSILAEKNRAEGVEGELRTDVNANAAAITEETSRAKEIEGELRTDVNANTAAISNEVIRAKEVEETLQTAINTETSERENAITSLTHSLEDETNRAEGAEKTLDDAIKINALAIEAEVARAKGDEAIISGIAVANKEDIAKETVRATEAETALNNSITSLTHSLEDETKRAEGVEKTLDEKIDNEINTARDNENKLSKSIEEVKTSVDTENERAEKAEGILKDMIDANKKSISDEERRASSAETALQTALEKEVTRAETAESEIKEDVEANTSAIEAEVARAKGDEAIISGIAVANKEDIAKEIARATNAEKDIDVTYDAATNKLTFVNSEGITTSYTLSQASLIEGIEYFADTKTLRIHYKNSGTEVSTYVDVNVADLFNQIEVRNAQESAIELTLEKNDDVGNDILSGKVKLSTRDTNLLINDNGNLYVSNQATDIKLTDGKSVAETITLIKNDLTNEIKKREDDDKDLNTALQAEIQLRQEETTKLSNDVTNLQTSVSTLNDTLAAEIGDRKLSENNINASIQAVSGIVTSNTEKITLLEASATTLNTSLASEISNRTLSELTINQKIDSISETIDTVKDDVSTLEVTTSTLSTDLTKEISDRKDGDNVNSAAIKDESIRAISAETEISGIAVANKEDIAKEIARAKEDEAIISGIAVANKEDIAKEITRALSAETALQLAIEQGSVKISKTNGNIISQYEDGIYAKSSQLTYDTGSNTLTFTNANGEAKPIVLNSIDTIKNIYFDKTTDSLVFEYTVGGEDKTVTIPAASFFNGIVGTTDGNVKVSTALTTDQGITTTGITAELDVNDIIDNTASTVKLTKTDANEIVANVNIAKNVPHNILEVDGSNSRLFVVGEASNISATYKDRVTDVQTVISEISSDITDLQIETAFISGSVKDMLIILNTHTDQIRVLSGDLNTEIETREGADKFISGVVDNNTEEINKLKIRVDDHDREIQELQEKTIELEERISAIESALTSGFSDIWKEIARLDKKSTIIDDDNNDYIKHTFTVNPDTAATYPGNTMIHTEISEDLGRDPDSGAEIDF